jgi:hypothetical protein
MDEHTADLRNVKAGDDVTIHTDTGNTFRNLTVTGCSTSHASEGSGEVRETTIWTFDGNIHCSIIDGLRSSPDDHKFPIHTRLYDSQADEAIGYIESVEIHGPVEISAEA